MFCNSWRSNVFIVSWTLFWCFQSPNIAQVGRLIGQKWRELSDEEKQPYHNEYEAEKAVYVEATKIYRSSPPYKRWLELKQQGELFVLLRLRRSLFVKFEISTDSLHTPRKMSVFLNPHTLNNKL